MTTQTIQIDPPVPARHQPVRTGLLVLLLVSVAVGCGGDRDDREDVRNQMGEPDDIQYIEGPISDFEYWTYFDYPVAGKNYEYRFERARNACGGNRPWIRVIEREYTPAGTGQERLIAPAGEDRGNPNPIKP